MGPKSTEIAREQEYFDHALQWREQARAKAAEAANAGADREATKSLSREGRRHQRSMGEPDEAIAFGRIDSQSGDTLYIGKHLIRGEDNEPLVINWQAPAAEPFYRASHADSLSLTRKRTFECTRNRIDDFTDVIFASRSGSSPDAEMLREMARNRTGSLREIVRTIQEAQFELIRAPLDQLLVVEGGPGTGKTAIALHRVSWLLYNHRDRLQAKDVLVVGPNPTFARYITSVLPSLGDGEVAQVDITKLAPEVALGRREPEALSRLKGDPRMAGLLERAVEGRIGLPEPAERIQIEGRFVTLPGTEVADAVDEARAVALPYNDRRQLMRDRLTQLLADRGVVGAQRAVEILLSRLWPQLSAASFLRDLLGSRDRLLAAAGSEFTAAEVLLLRRRAADRVSEEVWSRHDLPLLDEADHLLNGISRRFDHIVVDEVQDLSPMQLRAIARRSNTGSLTVVGDLAQSTGPWARDSWSEVLAHLPGRLPHDVVHLRFGYRVPRQMFEFASPLLAVAAPRAMAPEAVREGPQAPRSHRVDLSERAGRVAALAQSHAAERRFVGIVCAGAQRAEIEEALAANGSSWSSADRGELGRAINLVSPHEAKGLEFDAVIVVEPEAIVACDPRGLRLLYVALTRTTGHLDIVCVGEPLPLSIPDRPEAVPVLDFAEHMERSPVSGPAGQVAVLVQAAAPRERWPEVLREAARMLGER